MLNAMSLYIFVGRIAMIGLLHVPERLETAYMPMAWMFAASIIFGATRSVISLAVGWLWKSTLPIISVHGQQQ
jgi:hypothetical protein